MQKRFYWLKLKTDFFSLPEIDFLLSQKDGAQYVVLYQMLCLLTANTNGRLASEMGEFIVPFDVDKITREAKFFTKDTVTVALSLYKKLGLVYEQGDGILAIAGDSDTLAVQSESESAVKMRRLRARNAKLIESQCDQDVTEDVTKKVTAEIRDKSIDTKERDREKEKTPKHQYGEFKHVLLKDEEYEKLKVSLGVHLQDFIQKLDEYLENNRKKHYDSHYLTILNWYRRDGGKAQTKKASGFRNFEERDTNYDALVRRMEAGDE